MSDYDYDYIRHLKVKRLTETAKLPTRTNPTDAGLDFYSNISWSLHPGTGKLYSTGIAVEIWDGYVGLLWDRSGMGSKGIHRFAGVIDASYRGDIKVYLFNHSNKIKQIFLGDKIIQMIIQKVELPIIEEVDELSDTRRGSDGFGSSGM